jgi:phosphate transport system permease protein
LSFLFIEGAGVLLETLLIKGFIGSKWVKSVNRLEPSQKDVFDQKITGVSSAAKTSLSFCLEPDITDYYTEEELGENFVLS